MGKITVETCEIEGLKVITPTVFGDERGYFMETYNYNDYKEAGIDMEFVQDNQSMSKKGVLRGLHFQINFRVIVEEHIGIQDKLFILNGLSQDDGIGDGDALNLRWLQVKQGADEAFEYVLALLQHGTEHVVIRHVVGYFAGSIEVRG